MPPPKRSGARRRSSSSRGGRAGAKGALPDLIYAQASPRSIGGTSLFDAGAAVNSGTVQAFFSEAAVSPGRGQPVARVGLPGAAGGADDDQHRGDAGRVTSARSARAGHGGAAGHSRRPGQGHRHLHRRRHAHRSRVCRHARSPHERRAGGRRDRGAACYFQNAFAPPKAYWHLDVPADVSLGVNADQAHRAGITGRGVQVVHGRHGLVPPPVLRAARLPLGAGRARRRARANSQRRRGRPRHGRVGQHLRRGAGHRVHDGQDELRQRDGVVQRRGRAQAADHHLLVGLQHPERAAQRGDAGARGGDRDRGGERDHRRVQRRQRPLGLPGPAPGRDLGRRRRSCSPTARCRPRTTPAASRANIYPGRNVPDVSGLVGMLPKADLHHAAAAGRATTSTSATPAARIPNGDETANNDGWAAFSGTSAAAPQIAGVCALIKQACPRLTPAEVKDILQRTARDVTTGTCNPRTGGNAAGAGPRPRDRPRAGRRATGRC